MKDTPYLELTGELWSVFRELFEEKKITRYIENALYVERGRYWLFLKSSSMSNLWLDITT